MNAVKVGVRAGRLSGAKRTRTRGILDRVNVTRVWLGRSRHDRRCSWVRAPKVENKANQLRTQPLAFNESRPDWVSVRRIGWRMPATDARTATARARRVAGA